MKKFTITANPYGSEILVLVKPTKEESLKLLKKLKYSKDILEEVEADNFTGYATMYYGGDENFRGEYVLIFHRWRTKKDLDETLVHETNHLVHYIARRHGFLEEEEARAYLQEYLYREIRKLL